MNISDSRFMVETPFVGCDHSFYTLFDVSIRSWAGYAPPAAMVVPDTNVGNMAPSGGIEPPASGFGDRRSSRMS